MTRLTSSRFCGVPSGLLVSHSIGPVWPTTRCIELGELADGVVAAGADVDEAVGHVGRRHVLQQKDDRLGQVVDVQQLAARRAVPHSVTGPCGPRTIPSAPFVLVAPLAPVASSPPVGPSLASWNLRIMAGSTWLVRRSKLSPGP